MTGNIIGNVYNVLVKTDTERAAQWYNAIASDAENAAEKVKEYLFCEYGESNVSIVAIMER